MSRFIDRLNQVSQAAPQTIGFRTTQPASVRPKMQLVANVDEDNIDSLADYVTGADAGLLRISKFGSDVKTLKKIPKAMSKIPWGGWLGDSAQGKIKQMIKFGCDFVVFPAASTSLAVPQDDEVGKILQVEASLSEGLLRAVNELPVDAVLVADEKEGKYSLTWHHLMLFQRFADLLTKPLLVSIPPNTTANELQVLWEAGVDGVVAEAGTGKRAEELKRLRKVIDGLSFPSLRKQEKGEVLLPHIGRKSETVVESEGEEEEESVE